MTDRDKDDLGCKIARLLEKARGSGLRPDGSDDKVFMDDMWSEAEPNHPAAIFGATRALLYDAGNENLEDRSVIMPEENDDVTAFKMSMSAHFAALVIALDKQSFGVKDDFLKEIENLDRELKERGGDAKISESFWWTHQLIRGASK